MQVGPIRGEQVGVGGYTYVISNGCKIFQVG